MRFGDYDLFFRDGGVFIARDGRVLYKNETPLTVWIKAADCAAVSFRGGYSAADQKEDAVIASGGVTTTAGSAFSFRDEYRLCDAGIAVRRTVMVDAAGDDAGFASCYSLELTECSDPAGYRCFAPGFWYDRNQFARETAMGRDMSSQYYWFHETHLGLPLFAMFREETGEAVCFSRLAADVTPRSTGVMFSENSVDEKMTVAALGMHKCRNESVNYTYYGYGVRAPWDQGGGRLMIDYLYPASEGETPKPFHYGGLDFKDKAMDIRRTYHPVRPGFTHSCGLVIGLFRADDLRAVMRRAWRDAYERLRDGLFDVDNAAFFQDSMAILDRYTRRYPDGSWGLPFAAQLPAMDVNSVAFQFGFVGQQPGIGYQLLREGTLSGNARMAEKGMNVLDFWVRAADTDTVLPPSCYNPVLKGFEPYPYYLRMAADGLEAIQNAYLFLKKQGREGERPAWLAFLNKYAGSLCRIQSGDGSFSRAYTAEGAVRMDSKSNTPSVIRFLIEMYRLTGNAEYRTAAVRAGEWSYDNAYLRLEYRGGTCDNLDIQDKEAGIYALWGFIALYELTGEKKWLEAAKGAADYTETWTYAWSFPVHVPFPDHVFNRYSISGQSVITVQGGADVYMAVCPHTYLKMYFLTGDAHYLDFARFLNRNTRQATDVDGSAYGMRALGHESGGFHEQTFRSNYHWLPWCTFVAVDSLSRMKDEYGSFEVEDIVPQPGR